jgi:hypothetical protein
MSLDMDWDAKEKQAEAQLEQARRLVEKRETRLEVIRELRREDEKKDKRGRKNLNGAVDHSSAHIPQEQSRAVPIDAANREIADLLLDAVRGQRGRFTRNDIVEAAQRKHPGRDFKPRSVERPFQKLEQRELIRVVEPRAGPAPAVYEACEK